MILAVHFLAGAAIASKISPLPLAFIMAFLSHYFLDFVPHAEYSISNIKDKRWSKSFLEFLLIALDIAVAAMSVWFFAEDKVLLLLGGFFAILPDGLSFLRLLPLPKIRGLNFINKLLDINWQFHAKIHLFQKAKIHVCWKFISQLAIIFLAIFVLVS